MDMFDRLAANLSSGKELPISEEYFPKTLTDWRDYSGFVEKYSYYNVLSLEWATNALKILELSIKEDNFFHYITQQKIMEEIHALKIFLERKNQRDQQKK